MEDESVLKFPYREENNRGLSPWCLPAHARLEVTAA